MDATASRAWPVELMPVCPALWGAEPRAAFEWQTAAERNSIRNMRAGGDDAGPTVHRTEITPNSRRRAHVLNELIIMMIGMTMLS